MAETTEFVSTISVKDLITAFESKSESVRVEFSRPRAKSFGNVLNKNIVVRLNEFITLEDIETGLTKLETSLNFYEVYNKAKHVAFQEQFFNILTSIANIETDAEDAPVRKKKLISRTQMLVSFLNQKLPSHINQVPERKLNVENKYTPYSSHVKESPKLEASSTDHVNTKSNTNNDSSAQPSLYVESSSPVDVIDSGGEYFVSVKKLKETFQPKSDVQTEEPPNKEKILIVKQKVSVTSTSQNSELKSDSKHLETKTITTEPAAEKISLKDEKSESISVTKLRSMFEQRSEENSKGLEIITVEKPQLNQNVLGGSIQNLSLPYTDRNLGTFRLQRSVSGNYMNYNGLLKRVDINRSNSALELNKDSAQNGKENISDEESGADSDDTLKDRHEPEEVSVKDLIASLENQAASDKVVPDKKTSDQKQIAIIKGSEELQVKYSSNTEKEENNNNAVRDLSNNHNTDEAEVYYSTASFTTGNQNHKNVSDNVLSLQGYDEEEVTYSNAEIEDIKENENNKHTTNEIIFNGADETEVNYGTTKSETVQAEEFVAKLEDTTVEDVSHSKSTSDTEIDEVKNESSTDNTNISEPTKESLGVILLSHVGESDTDESINSGFYSFHDDDRERSLIEEEIDKIDVEQTLADADLVVNPEDLKNADDEFEKLIENTENSRVIA